MAELVTGEAVALDIRVARLASRGCALLLDLLLQIAILNVLLYMTAMTSLIADGAWTVGLSLLATVSVVVGYPCASETLSRGRTLGKLAVGLRVVADDGGPIRFRQALVRSLAGVIEFWTLYGAPALITSLCDRRGKRLGDLFAGTIVIQERVPSSAFGPVAVMPPPLAGWAGTLELSMLSDELAMTARQYLLRFWELLPELRDSLGQRIAGQVAAVVSPPPPPGVRPEILLSAILAERRRREEWRLAQRRDQRMRRAGQQQPSERAPVPAMAMAGPPPPSGNAYQGPPAPPPFSAPGPGQPQFLPPRDYGAGPYQGVLPPGPPSNGPYPPPHGSSSPAAPSWPQPTGDYPIAPPPSGHQPGGWPPQR